MLKYKSFNIENGFVFKRKVLLTVLILFVLNSCSQTPLIWPEFPLYDFNISEMQTLEGDIENIKQRIVGHYAHYDIVSYEDTTTKTPMRTFIISYGFTDFYFEDGKLMQKDSFVRASQKINQAMVESKFSDESVQAIKPRIQEVTLSKDENGIVLLHREPTPTLLGIVGDPELPLSTDSNDPNLIDPDGDGHPGVTVQISIGGFIKGELYITRREIYENYLTLNSDGSLTGYVIDSSEQFVIDASMKILKQESNNIQHPDPGLNPIILVPIDPSIDTVEELMEIRNSIFPPEPEFRSQESEVGR